MNAVQTHCSSCAREVTVHPGDVELLICTDDPSLSSWQVRCVLCGPQHRPATADVIAKLLQAGVTPRWWSKLVPPNEGARVPLTLDDLIDAHTFDWDAALDGLVT